ncbi:Gfo/Idh/MocA family protein [Arthrobacter sp. MMS24-T111]
MQVQDLAKGWGAPLEADWRKLVDLPGVGLAYVFGPHDGMAEKCLALIKRGIPFVVEKPLGTSLDELSAVRKAAEAAGVPATVPLVQRGGPTEQWLAKAGRPTYQRTSFIAGPPARYRDNANPWMLDPAKAGGGCLANLGPHFVDLFLRGTGETIARVDSRLSSALHHQGVEDHASLILTTPEGREAVVEVGYAFPGSPLSATAALPPSVRRDSPPLIRTAQRRSLHWTAPRRSTRSMWTATRFTIRSCGASPGRWMMDSGA